MGWIRACRFLWRTALLLALVVPVQLGAADAPRHGLMWNRSGLPLVFPLVIRTDPGRDYYVQLKDITKGQPVLAAFVEGGRHFRVLAPPGTFEVEIHFGNDWQGEERLFGARSGVVRLAGALTFRVENFNTKGGHLIDLRGLHSEEASLDRRIVRICQGLELAQVPLWRARRSAEERADRPREEDLLYLPGPLEKLREPLQLDLFRPDPVVRPTLRDRLPRWQVRYRVC